ncbi:MAG: hypothetical protein RL274_1042 [Pseudomonadota bacterium]|jgi:hypothetical protein
MVKKYTDAELVERMKSPGWGLKDKSVTGTLEDLAKVAHARHQGGEAPGLIEELETSVELEMIQIQLLWRQLGLPV